MIEAGTSAPRVVWTDAAQKLIRPRRGAPVKKAKPPAELLATVRGVYEASRRSFVNGHAHAPPPIADHQRAFEAHLDAGGPLSIDAAAAGLVLVGEPLAYGKPAFGEPLVDLFAATHGIDFTVRAVARSLSLRRVARADMLWVEPGPPGLTDFYGAQLHGPWPPLRAAVARTDDAAYANARAAAEEVRTGAPLLLRILVSFAFPDEQAWAEEAAKETLARTNDPVHSVFLLAALRNPEVATRIATELVGPHGTDELIGFVIDLVENLGVAAEDALIKLNADLARPWTPTGAVKHAALALAQVQSPKVATFFATHLEHKHLRAAAADYFQRAPHLAIVALAPLATGRKDSADATAMLESAVRANPALVDAVLPSLQPTERRTVEALRGTTADAIPDASADELPIVLRDPPWLAKKKRPAPPILEGLTVPPYRESVEGVKEQAAAVAYPKQAFKHAPGDRHFLMELLYLSGDDAIALLDELPHEAWYFYGLEESIGALLVKHGVKMIRHALAFASDRPAELIAALSPVDSTRVAPIMAHGLRLRSARRDAERWLMRHPIASVLGLLPDAVGKPGKARDAAIAALRLLSSRGQGDAVREAALRFGDAALRALDAALAAGDPLATGLPARAPKMPDLWNAAALPRPLLAGRKKALPLSAVEHLGAMLAFTRDDEPYAGLADVRAACDAQSLHDFAWALFSAWLLAGAPSKPSWPFFALGHLGGDEAARKLAPLIRVWPSEGAFGRAVTGLEVLALIGSNLALMLLHGIAQKVKSKGLGAEARAKMEAIAEAQGLGAEELADRLVPDLGLDADGSMLLDLGPRAFRVGFDEELRPFVRDASGNRIADLPKAAKSDDAEKSAAAADTWKRLKRDARAVAATQIARLELALVSRRRFVPEVFTMFLVEHPLLGHVAKRLVFGAYADEGALLGSFRVAEDRSFAGPADDAFAIPEGARIGLVHPIELAPDVRAAWGQILADYEILQPFPQIGREVFTLDDGERGTATLASARGLVVDGNKLRALDRFGWRQGPTGDGGIVDVYEKEVNGLRMELAFTPGLMLGIAKQAQVTIGDVTIYPTGTGRNGAITLGALDPILYSEIVRDLGALRP